METKIKEIENARVLRRDDAAVLRLEGVFEEAVKFLERDQICDVNLWRTFVDQFRTRPDDADHHWRCEYWGKMMRGAAMILRYTAGRQDYTQSYRKIKSMDAMEPDDSTEDRMYLILEDTVRDLLTTQDEKGRITTYDEHEFSGWDIWGRKYVLLGLQYFLEICRDGELAGQIVEAMRKQADYLLAKIGPEEGKIGICKTSNYWLGMNSCSVLEPIVRLYRITGEKRYFNFASYIISTGFCDGGDLIQLALEGEKAPYEYPVTKAYEMMSCFEGLIQYYDLTGIEKYRLAAVNFGKKVLETELSVIGCSGCTHELFDHTAVRQTDADYTGVRQETCVGVTWIKLASALLELTGDVAYADAIEQTFFNNYFGAMNRHRNLHVQRSDRDVPQVLPFDSYAPLTPDVRGKYVGGSCSLPGRTYYGCCACIGAAGAGAIPGVALMRRADGFFFGFYAPGEYRTTTPAGHSLVMRVKTRYPLDGKITVTVEPEAPETFAIAFRVPAWCDDARLRAKGKRRTAGNGQIVVTGEWKPGDRAELSLAMPVVRVLPPEGAVNADRFAAYRRGPVVLAADRRISDPDAVLAAKVGENGTVDARPAACPEIPDCMECYAVLCENGERVRLVDYASAGQTWREDSRMAAWIRRK